MSVEFDSTEWRANRDAMLMQWFQDISAVKFIIDIGNTAEVWDDLVDKDKEVSTDDINLAFYTLLIEMPVNPFFDRFKKDLIPLMIAGINAWQDANELEKGSDNDKAIAYVLRDWYVELVMFVVYLLHGRDRARELSMDIRRFFSQHETLHAYMEKLS